MIKKKYIVNAMGMHSSKYGGLEKFLVLLAEELNKHNISLIVVYNSEPWAKEFTNDIIQKGGKVIIAHAMHPLEYMYSFVKLFIKYKPVLVHAHFQIYYSAVYAWLLGSKRIFATIHTMTHDESLNQINTKDAIAPSTRFFRMIFNKITDRIFTVSNAVKQQYDLLFPEVISKTETLYLGSILNDNLPELSRKKLNIPSEKVIIGIICNNDRTKGLDVLMNAMVMLKNEYNYSAFMVCQIGIDPYDPCNKDIIDEFNQNGLTDFIQWMGIRNDVPELIVGMDMYCQPSRSEAIGLSIMEAGMAGLPIVGSNIGGIPEVVLEGYNGFLFENNNANQLAKCLFKLISNPELRREMGRNSKEYMTEHFNIQTQAATLCNIYLTELNVK